MQIERVFVIFLVTLFCKNSFRAEIRPSSPQFNLQQGVAHSKPATAQKFVVVG